MAFTTSKSALLGLVAALVMVFTPALDGRAAGPLPGYSEGLGARILAPSSPDAVALPDRPGRQIDDFFPAASSRPSTWVLLSVLPCPVEPAGPSRPVVPACSRGPPAPAQ
ncbi:MAG: hypothetical protein ACT4OM_12800 [Actinomycetota bacterium]